MNTHPEHDDISRSQESDLAALLQRTGKRAKPRPEANQMIEQATRQAWQAAVHQQQSRKRRKLSVVALAASVLLAIGGVMFLPPSGQNTHRVAQVLNAQGHVTYNVARSSPPSPATQYSTDQPPRQRAQLNAGETVRTAANASLTFKLRDNTLITLDQNTQVTLTHTAHINVLTGRIYVDSPDHNTSITVQTSFGDIVDIGTQYQVTVKAEHLEVAMREGITHIYLGGQGANSKALAAKVIDGMGDVMTINQQHHVRTSQLASSAEQWQWTHKTQPDFLLKQASVSELLTWAARMTGKEVVYASPRIQNIAEQIRFNGGQIAASNISTQLPLLFNTTNLALQEQSTAFLIE